MSEEDAIKTLTNYKNRIVVCQHIVEVGDLSLGFNVPEDINTDFEAWCDKCEEIISKEEEWTDKALKFADFKPFCPICFNELRESHINNSKIEQNTDFI